MKHIPCLHLPFKPVNDRQIDMVFEKLVEAAYTENPIRPTAVTAICDFTIPKDV